MQIIPHEPAARRRLGNLTAIIILLVAGLRDSSLAETVDYSQDVRPILARYCYACHGPDTSEGGLRLDQRDSVFSQLDSGAHAVVPGESDESALISRVFEQDPNVRMPPDEDPLSDEHLRALRTWVDQGAAWHDHWAFQPRSTTPIPHVRDTTWIRNPIDALIWHRLEDEGLTPAAPADRQVLVRRAYYDLTGLPPTPAQLMEFVEDNQPQAYERLVDRLLQSPQYGEKWARHWLDLVRFAETNSYERDAAKPHAWRYRDYVIRAFNKNVPFDQFLREQLAGDELPSPTADAIVATGYYRLGIWDDEPSDPAQLKYDVLDDIVKTTSQVVLGLTVDCARCHDHKIDPISQRDYYRLLAFFHNITPMQTKGDNIERVIFQDKADQDAFARRQDQWQHEIDRASAQIRAHENAFASAIQPGSSLVPPFDLERIHYQYFEGTWNELPDFDQLTPVDEGQLGSHLLSFWPRHGDREFAIVFEGLLRVPADGEYSFRLDGDDGVRLRIDGVEVAARDGLHGLGRPVTGQLELQQGRVPFRLEYFQNAESFALQLAWSGPDIADRSLVDDHQQQEDFRMWQFAIEHGDAVFQSRLMGEHRERVALVESLLAEPPQPPTALCVSETGRTASPTHVLMRGNPHAPTEQVEPGFPTALGGKTPTLPQRSLRDATTGRRLVLARWLTEPDHPLTARVLANRIWQHHFGRGIVRTSNDFGFGGDPPTHPQLLDWLANRLVDSGWRLKDLHRQIMLSNAYRMSSQVSADAARRDPRNQWFSHFNLRRLTAEEIRDSLLAANGRLNLEMYGPGFYPAIPAEVLAGQSRPGDGWGQSSPLQRARRSIYIHVKRSLLTPLLESFDVAETDNSCPVRFVTTQPTQALGMLNSEYLQDQAAAFAARLQQEAPHDAQGQLSLAFRYALCRAPSPAEHQRGQELLAELQRDFHVSPTDALTQLCLLLYNMNEFMYVE